MNAQRIERWGGAVALLVAVTGVAWLLRSVLTLSNFITIYILVVLVLAIRSGTRVAVMVSFISFLCINFFLVSPYYTFLISDPREVIDLVVFLAAALLVGRLAADARYRERTSQQFEEADRLKTALLRSVSHDLRTPITIHQDFGGKSPAARRQVERRRTERTVASHRGRSRPARPADRRSARSVAAGSRRADAQLSGQLAGRSCRRCGGARL
ncbi:MAG: DUF4118 domain-containing protein [Anaerolineae bacterium]|nr:DUF4118 domain-containing protein [Anaerolineae bacterium]